MSPSALMCALVVAQAPSPFERSAIDPFLPDVLVEVVKQADEAERDPKRGPSNALAVLEEAKRGFADDDNLLLAVRLREAGTVLRRHFLESKQYPLVLRYEQVVSTFARLDLADPGLGPWLKTALQNHPKGKAQLDKAGRVLRISILTRGAQLDRAAIAKQFEKAFEPLGFKVKIVPPKKARFVVKLGAENPKKPVPGRRAVRILMGMEGVRDGDTTWSHTIFRTEAGADAKSAIDSATRWLVRIGGRDMLFQYLGETAFPSLIADEKPKGPGQGHAGHGH